MAVKIRNGKRVPLTDVKFELEMMRWLRAQNARKEGIFLHEMRNRISNFSDQLRLDDCRIDVLPLDISTALNSLLRKGKISVEFYPCYGPYIGLVDLKIFPTA